MTPETVLAVMLSLATPGASIYSRVVVPEGSGRACEDATSLLCAAPRPDPAWGGQWTRPETRAEGLARYYQIATVVHDVAAASVWRPLDGCAPVRVSPWAKRAAPDSECGRAQRARPWTGTETELERYVITVALHESGFRRDVHAGRGAASRGDCKGGVCRSVCLGQIIKTRRGWRSPRGYAHEQLAGLDSNATRRCVETIVDYLSDARAACVSPYGLGTMGAPCVLASYGGLSTADDPRIRQRVRTFVATGKPAALADSVREELGL